MLLSNLSWNIAEKIIKSVSSIIIFSTLIQVSPESDYGTYSLTLSVFSTLQFITTFGLRDEIIKIITNNREQYSFTTINLIIFGFIIIILSMLMYLFHRFPELDHQIYAVGALLILQSIFLTSRYQLEANKNFSTIAKIDIVVSLILFPLKLYFSLHANLQLLILVIALEQFIANFIILIYEKQTIPIRVKIKSNEKIFQNSLPLLLTGLVQILYYRIDQIQINWLLGSSDLGIYSAALRITEIFYILPMALGSVLFPYIIDIYNGQISQSKKIKIILRTSLYISLITCFLIVILLQPILNWWAPGKFHGMYSVAIINCWTLPIMIFGILGTKLYICTGCSNMLVSRSVIALSLNFTLNPIAIGFYGIEGAAVMTLLVQLFVAIFYDLFTVQGRKVFKWKIKLIKTGGSN